MVRFKAVMLVVYYTVAVWLSMTGELANYAPSFSTILDPFGVFAAMRGADIETWTVGHLHAMGTTKRVKTAISRLGGGTPNPGRAALKRVIDQLGADEIGTVLLGQVLKDADPACPLAQFVSFVTDADHPRGDTCVGAGTAGAEGLDECTTQCERKRSMLPLSKTPPQGACYALCSLAVAPCGLRPFSLWRFFRETPVMVGATIIVWGSQAFTLLLRLSGVMVVKYLAEILWRNVYAWVALVFLFFAAWSSWATSYLLQQDVFYGEEEEEEGEEEERAMRRDHDAIALAMEPDKARIVALRKRGRTYRATQVMIEKRRLEVAGRSA